jgi:hypothetical protein
VALTGTINQKQQAAITFLHCLCNIISKLTCKEILKKLILKMGSGKIAYWILAQDKFGTLDELV